MNSLDKIYLVCFKLWSDPDSVNRYLDDCLVDDLRQTCNTFILVLLDLSVLSILSTMVSFRTSFRGWVENGGHFFMVLLYLLHDRFQSMLVERQRPLHWALLCVGSGFYSLSLPFQHLHKITGCLECYPMVPQVKILFQFLEDMWKNCVEKSDMQSRGIHGFTAVQWIGDNCGQESFCKASSGAPTGTGGHSGSN